MPCASTCCLISSSSCEEQPWSVVLLNGSAWCEGRLLGVRMHFNGFMQQCPALPRGSGLASQDKSGSGRQKARQKIEETKGSMQGGEKVQKRIRAAATNTSHAAPDIFLQESEAPLCSTDGSSVSGCQAGLSSAYRRRSHRHPGRHMVSTRGKFIRSRKRSYAHGRKMLQTALSCKIPKELQDSRSFDRMDIISDPCNR